MRNIKCRNCIEYRKDWCHKVNDDPYPDIVRDCQYYREKTNADHIRNMSDEELAEVLCVSCAFCACHPLDNCPSTCQEGTLNWLKQPYGGE